ncbi:MULTISPECIES: DUF4270 domain-containing protein [Flavobacterium]|uniref:DUF4270 domain-containing protein n=1 Tax=Flavobacterium TaxID=237 RepID=UPI001FCC6809|nr:MULTISPECIES: DUF4270 domain-containing protein [Flavobacterium]UOK43003.1 DUF4270 domain-containing protein [Flavobacterium enshiense]
MNKFTLAKKLLLLVTIVLFASCDKDFNSIGSDIVGDDHFALEKTTYEVKTNNFLTGPVQTNNLSLNSLGTYVDPAFGRTTSHFVTQAEMEVENVTVNTHPQVDSVWVYVPFYYGKQTGTDANGVREYELDSIYGDGVKNDIDLATQKFKLKIYENGYYLENYNPNNPFGVQRFYSDDKGAIESNLRGAAADGSSVLNGQYLNNSVNESENEEFFFDKKEHIIYKTNDQGKFVDADGEELTDQITISKRVVKERFTPGIWLNLNKEYFTKRILEADPGNLINNNTFKKYFRGLYFQVEALDSQQGALASLDFTKGYIMIKYNMDNVANSPTPTQARSKGSLKLKLGGNCINFFDNNHTLPAASNRISLKGGAGSVATIDLFDLSKDANGNQVPDELDKIREDFVENNWMINEANLTFYVDKSESSGMGKSNQEEPTRIYVYDAKNKRPVVDYFSDGSTNSSNPKLSKIGFGGIIEKDASGHGVKYKIRITDHMKNLIKNDSTNYTLGLSVTESINVSTNAYRKPAGGQPTEVVPLGSVLSPLGTILYDATVPASDTDNYDKRIKLEIYYTKPD